MWIAVIIALLAIGERGTLALQIAPTRTQMSPRLCRLNNGHVPSTTPFTQHRMALSPQDQKEEISSSSSSRGVEEDIHSQLKTSLPLDRPLLAALDVASLTAFAAVGKASHAPDGSMDVAAVAVTAAPFVVAWLGTSPWTGVYHTLDNDRQIVVASLVQTTKGWALAVPLGCAFRGVIRGYLPPISFVVVTLLATLVILCGTRALYAVAERKVMQPE